uniref:mitochondrial carrier homolog 1-like isoform X3 n=1 Tax=Gasterosteus aculeatus aculeatus TaxID=481459 RepID=UPI001A9980DA|nr:mitochondrial carrier homolog 1-like isoform X3 [Gasterosteus aculeatus aculeatus]
MESPENPSGQAVGVGRDAPATPVDVDTAVLLLGAGVTAFTHPLLYVKLLIQMGHEPLPSTVGTTMFGRRVLYLPGFFSYVRHIVKVDGSRGLFRGLSPRIMSSAISTVVRSGVKRVHRAARCSRLQSDMEVDVFMQVDILSKKDDLQTSLSKVVKETSHEMLIQSSHSSSSCHFSAVYGPVCWKRGQVWFSQASAIRSYTKFVMGIAVSVLTYPFMLVADLMAVNNCGLAAGLPPHSPIFKSWRHCWNHLSNKGHLFRGSSFFFRRAPVTSLPYIEE